MPRFPPAVRSPWLNSARTTSDCVLAGLVVLILSLWVYTRFYAGGEDDASHLAAMPSKVQDEEERRLYLKPAGLYTESDIAANGGRTASEAFPSFRARHDFNPRPGDRLCPISRTKANPQCAWTIGGQRYEFCCPPCIDELVLLAKEQPDQLQPPEAYVQPGASDG